MRSGPEAQRHLIVFDVNVYLDVARHLGPPFSWEEFADAAARTSRHPFPYKADYSVDSLRAIAMCTSGRFAGDEPVEVWTNAHIDGLVRRKAEQPVEPDPVSGLRGLGWSTSDAQGLVTELVQGLTEKSSGGTLGAGHFPDGNPPLDHEDGMVYGACRFLAGDDPLAHVYCVTRDRGFLDAYRAGRLGGHSIVLTPAQAVGLMRRARTQLAVRDLRSR